jgi:hypothetical protein
MTRGKNEYLLGFYFYFAHSNCNTHNNTLNFTGS